MPPPRDRVVANLWRAYEARENHADVSEGSEEATEETAPIAPFRAKTFSLSLKTKTRRANDGGVVGAGRDAYWRGPAVLADAPRAYRAAVETVAELACVAPETLHACVLDVDAALEARERGLREEKKAFLRETEAAGKSTPKKKGKRRRDT